MFEEGSNDTCSNCRDEVNQTAYVGDFLTSMARVSRGGDGWLCGNCLINYVCKVSDERAWPETITAPQCNSCGEDISGRYNWCESCVDSHSCNENADHDDCHDDCDSASCERCDDSSYWRFCSKHMDQYVAERVDLSVQETLATQHQQDIEGGRESAVKYDPETGLIEVTAWR